MRQRLRVISLVSARDQVGLGDLDLEVMVFVRALRGGWIERNLVKGNIIGEAFPEGTGNVIRRVERKAAALDSEHRQSQVPNHNLIRFADALEKLLIVGSTKGRLSRPS